MLIASATGWLVAWVALVSAVLRLAAGAFGGEPVVLATVRIAAWVTAGTTAVATMGTALAAALAMWIGFRSIDLTVAPRTIIESLWPAFAVAAVYAGAGAVAVWQSAPIAVLPADQWAWEPMEAAVSSTPSVRTLIALRPLAAGMALVAVVVAVRRSVRCGWLDAGIGVGCAAALLSVLWWLSGVVS